MAKKKLQLISSTQKKTIHEEYEEEFPLHQAAKIEDEYEAASVGIQCLDKGIDINACDHNGHNALHIRIMRSSNKHTLVDRFIDLLLIKDININTQDKDGNTAIHLATNPSFDYIILLEANPDLSLKNNKGLSVLDVLKDAGYYDENAEEFRHYRCKEMIDRILDSKPEYYKFFLPKSEETNCTEFM